MNNSINHGQKTINLDFHPHWPTLIYRPKLTYLGTLKWIVQFYWPISRITRVSFDYHWLVKSPSCVDFFSTFLVESSFEKLLLLWFVSSFVIESGAPSIISWIVTPMSYFLLFHYHPATLVVLTNLASFFGVPYSYGPTYQMGLSTYNPIYGMYNPIEITRYN